MVKKVSCCPSAVSWSLVFGKCRCVCAVFWEMVVAFYADMGRSAPRSGNTGGTNNLPPLLFHQVHGDNIRISRDGTVARRAESFCKGVTFSCRPVKIAEKVCVKFLEVSNNWSGVVRFGFTCNDPNNLRYGLPKYVCPDLTNKPGYWAKALAERFAERDTILFYYVTATGDVHFGINGEEKGVFFSGVETRGPLWAVMDVYGNSTAVELVDTRQHLNNAASRPDTSPDAVDRIIVPSLTSLSLQQAETRLHQGASPLAPLQFHRTRGRNVRLSNDRCIASRIDTEFCHGYVFTGRPILLGEKIVLQVVATEPMYMGALAFGLTSCDPATLQGADLPDDCDVLLDRQEYWVVSKDVAGQPQRGEVQFSKNGCAPVVFMHVDQTLQMWAFWDVYGCTQKVRLLGTSTEQTHAQSSAGGSRNTSPPPRLADPSASRLRVNLPCNGGSPTIPDIPPLVSLSARPSIHELPPLPVVTRASVPDLPPTVTARFCCAGPTPVTNTATAELVQYNPGMGGTVLVVNLPPAHSNYLNQQQQQHHHQSSVAQHHHAPSPPAQPEPSGSGTLLSTYSHTYIEPISATSYSTLDSTCTMQQWADATATGGGTECTICYERPIDSVLYMCGHMCMCYECAVQQWRGKGGGHCPLCRAIIRDVIRTYKS
uniref:Protein neuralized n=1 Tax=Timema cristinae TaxID=61476 RepID=A0A7R9CWF8_TIMCR|nr:unnamed protein product [Timema cristinae]